MRDRARAVVIGESDDLKLARAEPAPPVARSLADDAWIFFTSGTTGRSKGARLTHGNLLAMTAAYYAEVTTNAPTLGGLQVNPTSSLVFANNSTLFDTWAASSGASSAFR